MFKATFNDRDILNKLSAKTSQKSHNNQGESTVPSLTLRRKASVYIAIIQYRLQITSSKVYLNSSFQVNTQQRVLINYPCVSV